MTLFITPAAVLEMNCGPSCKLVVILLGAFPAVVAVARLLSCPLIDTYPSPQPFQPIVVRHGHESTLPSERVFFVRVEAKKEFSTADLCLFPCPRVVTAGLLHRRRN